MLSDVYCGVSNAFCCLCRLKWRNLIICRWTFLPHFDIFFDRYVAEQTDTRKKETIVPYSNGEEKVLAMRWTVFIYIHFFSNNFCICHFNKTPSSHRAFPVNALSLYVYITWISIPFVPSAPEWLNPWMVVILGKQGNATTTTTSFIITSE